MRDLRILALSHFVTACGDWLLKLAIPFYVFERTSSPLATVATVAASSGTQAVVGPFAGAFVDRMNRVTAIIGAQLVSVIAVAALVLAAWTTLPIWLVYAILGVQGIGVQIYGAARSTCTRALASTPEQLVATNSDQATGESIARLLGPPAGGLLLASQGLAMAALVDLATFAIAIVGFVALRGSPADGRSSARTLRVPIFAAKSVLRENGQLRRALLAAVSMAASIGATGALLIPVTQRRFDLGATQTGLLFAGQAIFSVLGARLARRTAKLTMPVEVQLAGMLAVTSGLIMVFAFALHVGLAAASFAMLGLPAAAALVTTRVAVQRLAPPETLGAVAGSAASASVAATTATVLVSGYLAERSEVAALLLVAGTASCGLLAVLKNMFVARSKRTGASDGRQRNEPTEIK